MITRLKSLKIFITVKKIILHIIFYYLKIKYRTGGENMETTYFNDIEGMEEYWGYEPVYDESEN